MISVNQRAIPYVRRMIDDCEALNIQVHTLKNKTIVIDCGIEAVGSMEAGLLFSEISMGGLGRVSLSKMVFDPGGDEFWLPAVTVHVSHPVIGCIESQMASWPVRLNNYFAMGSGPACGIYKEREYSSRMNYKDRSSSAVLLLEGNSLPTEEVAELVAGKCGISADCLTLIAASAGSLVGAVQIAARVIEVGMHKLMMLDFDIHKVVSGIGYSPIAPVVPDEIQAMGRANDAILYGSQVYFTVRGSDKELAEIVKRVPSSSSKDYGDLFINLFNKCGGDFYLMDPLLFSPAEVILNNTSSGKTFKSGAFNLELLKKSLF